MKNRSTNKKNIGLSLGIKNFMIRFLLRLYALTIVKIILSTSRVSGQTEMGIIIFFLNGNGVTNYKIPQSVCREMMQKSKWHSQDSGSILRHNK